MSLWDGINITVAARPDDPIDAGIAIDPAGSAAIFWALGADGVVHIEQLSAGYVALGKEGS